MSTKFCNTCKKDKKISEFSKDKDKKDGLQFKCKQCYNSYRLEKWDIIYSKKRAYVLAHKEKTAAYHTNYYKENKENIKQYSDNYRKKNKAEILTKKKTYREKNKKEICRKQGIYQKKHRAEANVRQLRYMKNRPDKVNSRTAKRRAIKLQATPPWLTNEQFKQIEEFYTLAKELQWLSEESLQVDHIIPLQGENVCGLHVPWNLQILPQPMNASKGNRLID